jgi:hypothetical protein
VLEADANKKKIKQNKQLKGEMGATDYTKLFIMFNLLVK